MGYEINSVDMTFYWNLFRRHFYSEGLGLWFDGCGNGLSLVANPLYGLFYFVNGLYSWMSYGAGLRVTYLAHYWLFGVGFALWGRELKFSFLATVSSAALICASGIVLSMASRNIPYLFPMVWLPFVGFFALKWFEFYKWQYAVGVGIAIGTSYMAGDLQAILYGGILVVVTWWMQGRSRFNFKKVVGLMILASIGLAATAGFSLYHGYKAMLLSDRSVGLSALESLKFSFHPYRVMEFFWFRFFGKPGTEDFWGQAYTSSLIDSQHRWWYGSVYLGFMSLPLAVAACWLLIKNRKWRGYAVAVLLLSFWSTGVWNPVVSGLVEHLGFLRMVRYPAKTLLPALILAFPVIAATLEVLFVWVSQNDRIVPSLKKWVLLAVIGLLIGPPLFQELPFQMLPAALNDVPKVLMPLSPGEASSDRVITNMYSKVSEHTALNMHLLDRGPLLWNRKSFFCPDAALTEIQRAVSLDDFSFSDARENFNVSHIVAGPTLSPTLQQSVDRGELKLAMTDPIDGTKLLAAANPPPRVKILTGWKTNAFVAGDDAVKTLKHPSLRADAATVNERIILDERGELVRDLEGARVANWQPETQAHGCSGSTEGAFRPEQGSGVFTVETTCRSYLAVNVRFTPGWQVTIDGVKTWAARLNELMVAVPVPEGRHEVLLEFKPRYYRGFVQVSVALQILMFAGALILGSRAKSD